MALRIVTAQEVDCCGTGWQREKARIGDGIPECGFGIEDVLDDAQAELWSFQLLDLRKVLPMIPWFFSHASRYLRLILRCRLGTKES